MLITFLGTRGYIDAQTKKHHNHTSTLIEYSGKKIMIDCGLDWSKKIWDIKPDAIVITHAHPDHAFGLKEGSPCPVYATADSWEVMKSFAIDPALKNTVYDRELFRLGFLVFEPFSLVHSIRAPAVGYRISTGSQNIFCAHDIVAINERHAALKEVLLYIGDGASIKHPIVRKKDDTLFGHASISTQLAWCHKEGVPYAIFTHCGSQIVEGNAREVHSKVRALAQERSVGAAIAYDGLSVRLTE